MGGVTNLTPGSPEWARRITASKVAAILGLSPFASPRSVWHLMHGDLPAAETSAVQARGHYLEPAILAWFRDQHGLTDDRQWVNQPTYALGDWAAATPDAMTLGIPGRAEVLVEAKSAARDDGWGTPGTDEIPAYYLAQVVWQMHVSGIHRCYVPMIGPRLAFAEYVVDYEPFAETAREIEARCREFYDSLATDTPPPLDDTVATYDAVRKVHPDIDRGAEVELSREVAAEVAHAVADLKAAEARARLAKATVIDLMGNAQHALHAGTKVARRQPRGDDVSFVVVGRPSDFVDTNAEAVSR